MTGPLETRTLFEGKTLALREERWPEGPYEIVARTDAVVVVAADGDTVVLVRQFRPAAGGDVLELPAGKLDEGESPEEAARRELEEETGYAAREIVALGSLYPNPAIQNNRIHTFVALDAEFRRAPVFESTEHTAGRLFSLTEVPRLISESRITHALVVAGFQLLYEKLSVVSTQHSAISIQLKEHR